MLAGRIALTVQKGSQVTLDSVNARPNEQFVDSKSGPSSLVLPPLSGGKTSVLERSVIHSAPSSMGPCRLAALQPRLKPNPKLL